MTEKLSEESRLQEKETKDNANKTECFMSGPQLLSSGPLSGATLTQEDTTLISCPHMLCFHFSFRTKNKKPFGNSATGSQIISTFKRLLQKRFVKKKKKNLLLKEKTLLPLINKSYIQIQLIRRSYQSASSSPLIHFKSLG